MVTFKETKKKKKARDYRLYLFSVFIVYKGKKKKNEQLRGDCCTVWLYISLF